MGIYQGPPSRTRTSKKLRPFRKKKKFQMGRLPTETELGERKISTIQGRGNTIKIRLRQDHYVNVSNLEGKTTRYKILKVIENPASVDYNRRGVITKGAILKTEKGNAIVTSKPGSSGVISAIFVEK